MLGADENVAVELQNQGKYADAERAYRAILAARRALPAADAALSSTLDRLAATIGAQGRYAEAAPLLQEALTLRLKLFGENDPLVAQTYNLVAINLENQGQFGEAEPLYRRALAIRRKAFGELDPSVATTLSNLALNLQTQGGEARMAEAGTYHVEALQISRKIWGDNSPFTATSFNNVANYLEQYGQYAEAEKLYRFALDIRVAAMGRNHPYTLTVVNNLAYNAEAQGRHAEAIALYRSVLAARIGQLGSDHPDLIVSYHNLAGLLAREPASRSEALDLERHAVALARAVAERERSGFAAGSDAAAQALTRAVAGNASGANPRGYAFDLLLDTAWRRSRDVPAENPALVAEAFRTAQDLYESAAGKAMVLTAARLAAGTGPLAALVQQQQALSRRAAELDAQIIRDRGGGARPQAGRRRCRAEGALSALPGHRCAHRAGRARSAAAAAQR